MFHMISCFDSILHNAGSKPPVLHLAPLQKIRYGFISLLFFGMILFSGCKPTPENDVIVNSGALQINDVVLRRAEEGEEYDVPDRWEETFNVRGRTIRIEADIQAAKGPFRVVLMEKSSFDAEKTVDIAQKLADTDLEIRTNPYSREELLTEISHTEKGWFDEIDEETGEWIWLPYPGQEEDLKALRQKLAEAPERDVFVPLNADSLAMNPDKFVLKGPQEFMLYGFRSDRNTYLGLKRYRLMSVQDEQLVFLGEAFPGEEGHHLTNIKLSESDAIAAGQALLRQIAPSQNLALATCDKARGLEAYTYQTLGEGYLLVFTSNTNGTVSYHYEHLTVDTASFYFPDRDLEYSERWPQERISMFVTDKGIWDLQWRNPKTELSIVNDNVKLLPFSEIQEKVKALISYAIEGNNIVPLSDGDLIIPRIVLGSAYVKIPDHTERSYQIPVWMIETTNEYMQKENKGEPYYPDIVMINALTGAYVSRWGW